MSKEQTPITAEEKRAKFYDVIWDIVHDTTIEELSVTEATDLIVEQTQSKVLEALERLKVEISKGENVYNHLEILQLIEIEITEVKPKYNLK